MSPRPPEPKLLPGVPAQATETIMIVEDHVTLRTLMRQVLSNAGYRVLETTDVPEALRLCETFDGEISLMVTDVVMPVMSGPQLAERAAKMRPRMKVLFSSGYPGAEMPGPAGELNFFEKPFTPDALLRKIREVLDASE
jgi:DNA-binding NtrC family response regulator